MRPRNEIFCQAVDYLASKEMFKGQKDLAMRAGLTQTTLSRIMTGKVEPSDDTLRKFNATFDGLFNMQWLRGIDPYHMLAADTLCGAPSKEENGTVSLLELAASLIKEVEGIRRNLQEEREQTRLLNAQLQAAIQKLETLTPSHDYLMASEEPVKNK